MLLSLITLALIRHSSANGAIMRRPLASWTYCALFELPLMSLIGYSPKKLPRIQDDARIFNVEKETREDLTVLSIAAPCMFSPLQATHSNHIICTDASTKHVGLFERRCIHICTASFGGCEIRKDGLDIWLELPPNGFWLKMASAV